MVPTPLLMLLLTPSPQSPSPKTAKQRKAKRPHQALPGRSRVQAPSRRPREKPQKPATASARPRLREQTRPTTCRRAQRMGRPIQRRVAANTGQVPRLSNEIRHVKLSPLRTGLALLPPPHETPLWRPEARSLKIIGPVIWEPEWRGAREISLRALNRHNKEVQRALTPPPGTLALLPPRYARGEEGAGQQQKAGPERGPAGPSGSGDRSWAVAGE